jgi:hypothetical protein
MKDQFQSLRSRRRLDHRCFSKTHFSTHTNIHIQPKSKSISFVRPEPRDEFTEPNFADGLSFTDPLIEKRSSGYPLICDWWYSAVQLVHCVCTWLFCSSSWGCCRARRKNHLSMTVFDYPIIVLFMILRSGWWNKFHRL